MRRIVLGSIGLYFVAAIATRAAEAAGAWHRCGCASDCWCKKPGLTLFRWVAPINHRSVDPAEQRALTGAQNSH